MPYLTAARKKGADGGIDGYYYCKPDGKNTAAVIVSVKGGENLHVNMVRELDGVIRQKRSPPRHFDYATGADRADGQGGGYGGIS